MRNRKILSNPIKVSCDKTPAERQLIKDLRTELEFVRNEYSDKQLIIKYVYEVPKIVEG